MIMQKVNWTHDGDSRIRLGMPISKVDVEKRQVSGWASIDNIDQHRDLVDALASRDAFNTFRGNIREQHDEKKAVGRLVNFREDTYFDPKDEKFYQGVYVTAYVSKGAQDTWEKILDGTLSGFSIGGNVLEAENEVGEDGQPFRRVKKYLLTELSLVDNPANQYANVVSFEKVLDTGETVVTGDLAELTIENIFVCNKCLGGGHGVHLSSEESVLCSACDTEMISIGFVESSDPEPTQTVKKVIDGYLADREGGVNTTMAKKNTVDVAESEKVVEVEETEASAADEATEETPAENTTEEEQTEEAAETEEENAGEETEEVDPITSAVNSLRELTDRIEQSSKAQTEELNTLRKSFSELDQRFEEKLTTIAANVDALEKRQDEFTKKFEGIDSTISEVRKSLTDVEESTAFKKSVDFDRSAEEPKNSEKGFWAGSFIDIESL